MKKGNLLFWFAIIAISFYSQFLHPINGLADDQIGLVTAEKVIENITPQDGYLDLMNKYIETAYGVHPASAIGLPWINPVYTLVTHGYSSLVGLSIPRWHFLSVLIFFVLIFFAKKLGEFFFGKYGFIFPILLAVNLYVLVVIRNSIILFSLSAALQLGMMYYFLKSHEKFNLKTFGLASLLLFLSLSNGSTYSPVSYVYLLVIFASLCLWGLINRLRGEPIKDFNFLPKRYYFFIFLLIPILSLGSYFTNDLILNAPLGSSLDGFLYYTKSRFPPTEFPTLADKISGSVFRYKEVISGTSFNAINGPHYTFFPYKTPVLDIVSVLLFFLGIISFLRKMDYKKFVLLAFFIYTSYFLYGAEVPRIYSVFIPFLLLISASGFVFLVELVKLLKLNSFVRIIIFLMMGIFLAYNVYYFDDYFVVKSSSNLIKGTGVAEIESYLSSVKDKKIILFMATGYPTWYLSDFRKNDFVVYTDSDSEKLQKRIKELEDEYNDVVLVFPSNLYHIGNPGLFAGDVWGDFYKTYSYFFEAFPERTTADKIVYDYQGIPAHYIYVFSKNSILKKAVKLVINDSSEKIPLNFDGEIQSLRIKGGAEKVKINDKEFSIKSSPSTDVLFNFEGMSNYDFYRNFANDSYKENLFKREWPDKIAPINKFDINTLDSLTWLEPNIKPDKPPYYLEYIFNYPYTIKKVDIKNDFRLFNRDLSKTSVKGYLVDKEKDFNDYQKKGGKFVIFKVESDNSNTYGPGGEINVLKPGNWGVGRLSSYVIKKLNTGKILVSLGMETKYYNTSNFLANYYTIGDSSFIKFLLDTTKVPKPKIKEGDLFSVEKNKDDKKPTVIDIIYTLSI